MGFRDRLKKVVSRNSVSGRNGSSSGDTTSSSSSSTTSSSTYGRKFSNPLHSVYGPDEVIPYKYKRPVNKEHKAKLESYSFAKAWQLSQSRKNSCTSMGQYSPMGSRMPSRRNSLISAMRRRNGSVIGIDDDEPMPPPRAREHLAVDALAASAAAGAIGQDFADQEDSHDAPFTQDQLTKALSNVRIDSPTA